MDKFWFISPTYLLLRHLETVFVTYDKIICKKDIFCYYKLSNHLHIYKYILHIYRTWINVIIVKILSKKLANSTLNIAIIFEETMCAFFFERKLVKIAQSIHPNVDHRL
jgi:hypothetical protein